MSDNDFPIPPATFEFLTYSLKTQTEMHLGLLRFGDEQDDAAAPAEPDFRAARHTLDLLSMLREKTKGNLTVEEERMLENSLTELRFRFVSLEKAAKPAPERTGE
jgi:hypothetical protein